MPKSKKSRVVTLNKTKSKLSGGREKSCAQLQALTNKYSRVFAIAILAISHENQLELRRSLPGQFILAKKTIARYFFSNRTEEGAEDFASFLANDSSKDQIFFLFTNEKKEEVQKVLNKLNQDEFGREGSIATATIVLNKGPEAFDLIPVSSEEHFKNLGIPIKVSQGKLELESNFEACVRGRPLNAVQSKVLRMLGIKVAKLQPKIVAEWDRKTGNCLLF